MKTICLLIPLFYVVSSYAQTPENSGFYKIPRQNFNSRLFSDSSKKARDNNYRLKRALRNAYKVEQFHNEDKNDIPNALTSTQQQYLKPVYRYNNGKGLNVYESPLDSMPVVAPDSTFYSAMPAGNYKILQAPLLKKKEENK